MSGMQTRSFCTIHSSTASLLRTSRRTIEGVAASRHINELLQMLPWDCEPLINTSQSILHFTLLVAPVNVAGIWSKLCYTAASYKFIAKQQIASFAVGLLWRLCSTCTCKERLALSFHIHVEMQIRRDKKCRHDQQCSGLQTLAL